MTHHDACLRIEAALAGSFRATFVDALMRDASKALATMRSCMRRHAFRTPAGPALDLGGVVRLFDERTQREGFHVLQEWAGDRFLDDPVPILMLDYFAGTDAGRAPHRENLAVLLDYYFLYVLALLLVRSWDDESPEAGIDRVAQLLGHLQGRNGSGMHFVEDAGTLFWIAISHYEPDDDAYGRLLERVERLDADNQVRIALPGAAVLGDHLRWGFPVYYKQQLELMRADNGSDYPWLLFCVQALLREWTRMHDAGTQGPLREKLVGALLNGMTPDPGALLDTPPPTSLAAMNRTHAAVRSLVAQHREALCREFAAHHPRAGAYSPLGFQFNFPHNVLIPMVALALTGGIEATRNVPFDALLERDAGSRSPLALVHALAAFAGASPERRGGRETPMIAYNPDGAVRSFDNALAFVAGRRDS